MTEEEKLIKLILIGYMESHLNTSKAPLEMVKQVIMNTDYDLCLDMLIGIYRKDLDES